MRLDESEKQPLELSLEDADIVDTGLNAPKVGWIVRPRLLVLDDFFFLVTRNTSCEFQALATFLKNAY